MGRPTHGRKHCREWSEEERADVFEVVKHTARDDTGISYTVSVGLRSFAEHAYEDGEDQLIVWSKRVEFGSTDATCSGGSAFVQASHEQENLAAEIVSVVWGV